MAQSGPAAREAAQESIQAVVESIPGGEKLIPAVDPRGRSTSPSSKSTSSVASSEGKKKAASSDSSIDLLDDEHISRIVNGPDGSKEADGARSLTVAFMKCDELHENAVEEHGGYEDVIHNLFEPILKERTQASQTSDPSRLSLCTLVFDAVKREYPSERQLRTTIDAVVISGSFQDGASEDTRWILRLAGFLIKLYDEFPRIRIIGICFGLQIIARAFGPNKIVPNPKGHEIGSTKLYLTELGRKILHPPHEDEREGREGENSLMLQQVHGDIVDGDVPEDFELLAWSDKTPIQAIAHLYPDDKEPPKFLHSTLAEDTEAGPPSPWSNVHIIGVQGHPEWHEAIILPLVDDYEKKGTLSKEEAAEARRTTKLQHDGRNVGRALLAVLGFV